MRGVATRYWIRCRVGVVGIAPRCIFAESYTYENVVRIGKLEDFGVSVEGIDAAIFWDNLLSQD